MTNYRSDKKDDTDQEICLEKISVASKNYKVKALIEGDKRSGHSIGWREQVSLHYLIIPKTVSVPGDVISHCSALTHASETQDIYGSTIADFTCLEHAFEEFKV